MDKEYLTWTSYAESVITSDHDIENTTIMMTFASVLFKPFYKVNSPKENENAVHHFKISLLFPSF